MTGRPHIEYPCEWTWRLIGEDETAMRAAVAALVADSEHELVPSNASSSGRYTSLRLRLTVRDETERLSIQQALDDHASIRMVL